ncbi:TPA: TM0106 family RecB-like putative nuclease [Legionella pneumophila]|nr:TM0106 family RecB-like putative nuclease [Legionella pneumophila]
MGSQIEISPSLFFKYAKSPHWIWYDLHGDQSLKEELPELTQKLIEGGMFHEEDCVKDLEKITVDEKLSEQDAEKQTLEYMKAGAGLIYQGVISYIEGSIKFKGRPDILKKCEGPSNFGDYYYIPIEIKNSKKCDKPEYKKQLVLYALILEKIQGLRPSEGGFINKNKESLTCKLTDKILQATNDTVGSILNIFHGNEPPIKISRESLATPWGQVLLDEAKQKSDIALLYSIRADVLAGLKNEGIETIRQMSECDIDSLPKIKGASDEMLKRLQTQARSLVNNEIIPRSKPDIPEASTKIYFDIEGDPFLEVEYLFGFWVEKENTEPEFKYFLAETPEDEKTMWVDFLSWIEKENFVNYKVYHFHNYEKTRLNKLSKKYGYCPQLAGFIENLVDLSKKLTESFIFPVYFYSIKDIAKYLDFKWQHEKAGGAQSIFWYEKWLETTDHTILQDIINYNEDDVRATSFLHGWLSNYK